MPQTGVQNATIVSHSVYTKENGTVDVSVKVEFAPQDSLTAHIYITEKSKGMARAALKKCGFDPDEQDVWDLDDRPTLLAGNKVQVDVFDDDYNGKTRRKAEIVIERQRPDVNKMKKATMLLREAKSADDEAEESQKKIIEGFPQPQRPKEPEAPF